MGIYGGWGVMVRVMVRGIYDSEGVREMVVSEGDEGGGEGVRGVVRG